MNLNEFLHIYHNALLLEGQNKNNALSYISKLKPNEDSNAILSNIISNCPAANLSNNKWLPAICKLNLVDGIDLEKLDKLFFYVDKYQNTSAILSLNIPINYKNIDYNTIESAISEYVNRANSKEDKKQQFTNATTVNNYKIIPLLMFKDAEKYKYLASWCICARPERFYDYIYTENGKDKWYLLINQDTVNKFDHNSEEEGKYGNNNQEYALSAIIVNVRPDGSLYQMVNRYNDVGGDSHGTLAENDINKCLGQDYHNVLQPFTEEEVEHPFKLAQEKLDDGENPNNIFDLVFDFYDGFARVQLNNKWNFINKKGQIISQQWFDNTYDFHEGFGRVRLNNKYNFINKENKIISQQWFGLASDFCNGFAAVQLNDKFNFINREGQILYEPNNPEKWFDWINDFSDGFAPVKLNDKYNFINKKGQIISQQWFDETYDFSEGLAKVELNHKWNFINKKGQILYEPNNPEKWFDNIDDFYEDFARVQLNNKWNFINKKGQILYEPNNPEKWFDYADNFVEGLALVGLNNKWDFINTQSQLYDYNTKQPIPELNNEAKSAVKPILEMMKRMNLYKK